MTSLTDLSLSDALAKMQAGEITSVALTQAYLDSIAAQDAKLGAYITVDAEGSLEAAHAADQARADGDDRPLLGVPLAIKDLITTEGTQTTAGSKILEGYVPVYDATVIRNLKDAGYILLGKVNLDEFGMGGSNENSGYFPAYNPWDTNRVPGGSSGGSAVAVAAGMAAGSLGTDTGGSVRLPGAWCGVTALKPSYGRVSRFGLIAFGSSLDSIGPLGRSVEDVARMLQVMAGYDPRDSTSMNIAVPDYLSEMQKGDLKGMKAGLPKEYFADGLEDDVRAAVEAAIKQYEGLGVELHPVSLSMTDYSLAAYYLIATSEASSNLARFDGIRFGPKDDQGEMWDTYRATRARFGEEVQRRIMLGTYALSAGYYDAYYGKAQAVRTLIKREFDSVFEQVDFLLTPVTPTSAFKIGAVQDPLQMYLADVLTVGSSLAGVTAMSIPCGEDEDSLPVGLQIIGQQFNEEVILKAAHAYQQVTDWHKRRPTPIT